MESTSTQGNTNGGIEETDYVGNGALLVTITLWPQVEQLVKGSGSTGSNGDSDTPSNDQWFTEKDFDRVLKKIKEV